MKINRPARAKKCVNKKSDCLHRTVVVAMQADESISFKRQTDIMNIAQYIKIIGDDAGIIKIDEFKSRCFDINEEGQ